MIDLKYLQDNFGEASLSLRRKGVGEKPCANSGNVLKSSETPTGLLKTPGPHRTTFPGNLGN